MFPEQRKMLLNLGDIIIDNSFPKWCKIIRYLGYLIYSYTEMKIS